MRDKGQSSEKVKVTEEDEELKSDDDESATNPFMTDKDMQAALLMPD